MQDCCSLLQILYGINEVFLFNVINSRTNEDEAEKMNCEMLILLLILTVGLFICHVLQIDEVNWKTGGYNYWSREVRVK
jgi:hypothetical protein